jgi:hydroxylamine dehydrogenase
MMKNPKIFLLLLVITIIGLTLASCGGDSVPDTEGDSDNLHVADLSVEAKACVECHATETTGIASDWDGSRHAGEAVSCIDCHEVDSNSDFALTDVKGHEDLTVSVSMLVPPSTCNECHEEQVAQFDASGHHRAGLQVIANDSMQALMHVHEGQNHPEFYDVTNQTGCAQCHGLQLEVDETGHPTSATYPMSGIGNIYPNGEVGNCTVCHTRHSFEIAEARKPDACASCHLGPDHPDIEIYENSKHGQIFAAEGEDWIWDSAPGEWEPGDYRAPTCATCHMSGIGELETTHNVTERLYWNLWAKVSKVRTEADVMAMYYGDGTAGRDLMEKVCSECHSATLYKSFLESADNAVRLYNEVYFEPAEAMRAELADRGLLKENPWKDEFQITYYYLWHHEGRRARQGALMGGPDWAHWHGFFDLMQDIYKLEEIYKQRIETRQILD